MFWSGFGWVWLGLVKFCKVFDTFIGLLEHVLVWVWLGLVRLWLSFGRFNTFLGHLEHVLVWVWLGLVKF